MDRQVSPAGGGLTPALVDRHCYQANLHRCYQRVPVCAMTGNYSSTNHRIGTYRSKYPRVPNCPQPDEFDERTPAPHTTKPVREAGKEIQ